MKKLLLIAAVIGLGLYSLPSAEAQTNTLIFGNVPATIMPGQSFTFSITLNWAPGGQETNLQGMSLWLWQSAGPGSPSGPFTLSLTNRDVTGSFFDTQQTSNSELFGTPGDPDNPARNMPLEPINDQGAGSPFQPAERTDLGGTRGIASSTAGQKFIANITLSTSLSTVPGTYTISNTTSSTPNVGGRISVTNGSNAVAIQMPQSSFMFTVIPEPSTYALMAFGGIALCAFASRRRALS